jgi:two-component system cell cycle sensor histidine kinase/response regulator CckA
MPDPLPNVLIVDDDKLVLEFVVLALNKLGYVAVGRTDTDSAMEVVNTTPSLELLLSDICLESSTGPDLVRQALRDRPELKVVFMTGGFDVGSFRKTDLVLNKPFDLQGLRRTIDSIFNRGQPRFEPPPAGLERRRPVANG